MSEWIEWGGGDCPVPRGTLVDVRHRSGLEHLAASAGLNGRARTWYHDGTLGDIIAYRLHERRIAQCDGSQLRRADEPRTAQSILRRAADLIEERGAQRDQANGEKSMAKTVQAFNAIYGTELTEVQGWHFMELLKMVRSAYGRYVADDYDDKVAYAALAAEAAK